MLIYKAEPWGFTRSVVSRSSLGHRWLNLRERNSHPLVSARDWSRSHLGTQNPQILKPHSEPSVSAVPHPQIQPTTDRLVCIY